MNEENAKTNTTVPEGYMEDGQGNLIPMRNVRELDKIRDALVRELIGKAGHVAEVARAFKGEAQGRITAFVSLAAQEHGVEMGGEKGNVTLTSFDGRYKVKRAMDDVITFNEGVTVARQIFFRLVAKWSEGSNANLAAIVHKAFETDKDGHLSVSKLMMLNTVEIDDPDWKRAMEAIRQSIQVVSTKSYVRFYERGEDGGYRQIAIG